MKKKLIVLSVIVLSSGQIKADLLTDFKNFNQALIDLNNMLEKLPSPTKEKPKPPKGLKAKTLDEVIERSNKVIVRLKRLKTEIEAMPDPDEINSYIETIKEQWDVTVSALDTTMAYILWFLKHDKDAMLSRWNDLKPLFEKINEVLLENNQVVLRTAYDVIKNFKGEQDASDFEGNIMKQAENIAKFIQNLNTLKEKALTDPIFEDFITYYEI